MSGWCTPVGGGDGISTGRGSARRHRIAARTTDEYWRAGFDVVVQDIFIGDRLLAFLDRLTAAPVHVVVLVADPAVIEAREAARPKTGYAAFSVEELCAAFEAETPRIGLWLDTSTLTPDETVDAILERRDEARVRSRATGTRERTD